MSKIGILQVYVSTGCPGCQRAMELAQWIRRAQPGLRVEIVNLADEPDAGLDLVVAVPTYVYNDSPIFLGNPSPGELQTWLDTLCQEV